MGGMKSAALRACEAKLDRCLERSWRFGEVLREIRDDKLYEPAHVSFQAYCNDGLGLKGDEALWYVHAVEVRDNLARNGCHPLPEHLHQVSPLVGLPEDEQVAAWKNATSSG